MKRANYIDDGYTQPGFIAPSPLVYESLRFIFRPVLVGERSQLIDRAAATKRRAPKSLASFEGDAV